MTLEKPTSSNDSYIAQVFEFVAICTFLITLVVAFDASKWWQGALSFLGGSAATLLLLYLAGLRRQREVDEEDLHRIKQTNARYILSERRIESMGKEGVPASVMSGLYEMLDRFHTPTFGADFVPAVDALLEASGEESYRDTVLRCSIFVRREERESQTAA
jgi:hypothetical protein